MYFTYTRQHTFTQKIFSHLVAAIGISTKSHNATTLLFKEDDTTVFCMLHDTSLHKFIEGELEDFIDNDTVIKRQLFDTNKLVESPVLYEAISKMLGEQGVYYEIHQLETEHAYNMYVCIQQEKTEARITIQSFKQPTEYPEKITAAVIASMYIN